MDMYSKYKSPLGYYNNDNQIDSYGVNHSGFSTQDELNYQTARTERENNLINQFNHQGLKELPRFGTNFWGNSANNNYGFGMANIEENIPKMHRAEPLPPIEPKIWETAEEGKKIYNYVLKNEGNINSRNQKAIDYTTSAIHGALNLVNDYYSLKNLRTSDKYKHALINCNAAQYGKGGADIAELASNLREWSDVNTNANTVDSSQADNYANKIGRLLGAKYPQGNCDELVQKYIKRR